MFKSIVVQDPSGQALAEFVALSSELFVGWPKRLLFAYKQTNPGSAIWVEPGTRYTVTSFVNKLAAMAGWDPGNGLNLRAVSTTAAVDLTRLMSSTALADLTGFDVGTVRELLRDFVTFAQA